MSKNTSSAAVSAPARKGALTTRTLACCAVLAAMSVVLARLVGLMPNEASRYSIEAVPVFVAGMLFGPLPGTLVGFAADFTGTLFSPYGFNPIFCVPPMLYGLCAGLFQPLLAKKTTIWTMALAFLPPIALGSILYQSGALALVYGGEAKRAFFLTKLAERSVQFAILFVVDTVLVWLLYKSRVFTAARLWPPIKQTKHSAQKKRQG